MGVPNNPGEGYSAIMIVQHENDGINSSQSGHDGANVIFDISVGVVVFLSLSLLAHMKFPQSRFFFFSLDLIIRMQ